MSEDGPRDQRNQRDPGDPGEAGDRDAARSAGTTPGPRGRRRAALALRLVLLFTLVATGLAAWVWHDMQSVLSRPMPTGSRSIQFTVQRGASLSQVARDLQSRGLIPVAQYLAVHARYAGLDTSLKAGEYLIEPYMTPLELLDRLVIGEVLEYSLTLIEGWTFKQMIQAVLAAPELVHTLSDASPDEVMTALGYPSQHPEGRFLAETYRFPAGTTDLQFLRRAYLAMEGLLAREWAARMDDLPYAGPDEALVLASIIEKETAVPEERARIGGVFVRRLRKRMRLQTDPTVIYGMGERFDGNLRRADLREDTPYNTYVHHGLPPTPIAMPGPAAIRAALHPKPGKSLYFVSRGDGRHHFSDTYEEHRKAVNRYQIKPGHKGRGANRAAGSG
jgi:UPF0755 protein